MPSRRRQVVIGGLMEHIRAAGIHSAIRVCACGGGSLGCTERCATIRQGPGAGPRPPR